jgi:hypothetical protein
MLTAAKAALLALAAFPLASATQSDISPWQHPEIVKVDCLYVSGTAFRVGPRVLLSVAHVVKNVGCTIGGKPFKIIHTKGDFAVLEMDQADNRWLRVDCSGFVKGKHYLALGYARGLDTQTEVEIEATGKTDGGQARLSGVFTVIPGQSGGPVMDMETGSVLGTVNTYVADYGLSGSVELKGTSVCPKAVAGRA